MSLRALTVSILLLSFAFWGCSKSSSNNNSNSQHNLHITSPSGGETWDTTSTHSITWTSNHVTHVTVQFSADGGANWIALATAIPNANSYAWTVPHSTSSNCKIKVEDSDDPTAADVSAAFSIVATAQDNASGEASSNSADEVTVETPAGAKLVIPPGAVPPFPDGSSDTQTFSIERTGDSPSGIPSGESMAGPVYRFGPEGFTFARPIEVTVPVTSAPESTVVQLYRLNPTTGQLTRAAATYDHANHVIRAQTTDFSLWFPTWTELDPSRAGCIHVTNASNLYWVVLCPDSVHLDYPAQATWLGSGTGLWAPAGHVGIASESNFHVPQGDYRWCVQWASIDSPFVFHHTFVTLGVHSPSDDYFGNANCATNYTFTGPSIPADTGRCICSGIPSNPVHTGAVQVTLNWYVADDIGRDLDLHVIEPDSEEIYYAHTVSATGGQLDRDNICLPNHNMQENIYWTQNPPHGQFIVRVHFYGNCGTSDTTYSFNVRTVVNGQTHTFDGQVNLFQTVEVTRFNVSSPEFVVYNPTPPHAVPSTVKLPPKE